MNGETMKSVLRLFMVSETNAILNRILVNAFCITFHSLSEGMSCHCLKSTPDESK
ncbi:hypothetical protein NIES2104_45410 [Leptolyngbya sp. NIES-2104]|nr:hypothetical protein NIES2104_45410 [Leptolyngbya sp. NIES-2104]